MLRNPFNQQALKQSALFSGEDNIKYLTEIRRNFSIYSSELNCESIFIHGERGNGKTSILRILSEEVKSQNYIPVKIFLQNDFSTDSIGFFKVIYESIFDFCKENEILLEAINQTEIAFHKPESQYWIFDFYKKLFNYQNGGTQLSLRAEDISNDLKKIITAINSSRILMSEGDLKIIYFIDEAQNVFGNVEILSCMRHLIQEEMGVSFVLACQFPYDHTNLNLVFGDLSRSFKIFRLDGFKNEKDVKDYIEKALKAIGWREKEFRVRVQNMDKIVEHLFKITNGKVAFVIKILNKMFEKIISGDDTKMRWNDPLLDEIAQDLLFSSGVLTGNTFNHDRALSITNLKTHEFDWFRFLISNFQNTTPNRIYDLYFVFFEAPFDSKEYFHDLFNKFLDLGCFKLNERDEKENADSGNGLDILNSYYYYSGCEEEKYWIQIKLGLQSRHLNFGQTFFTSIFLSEIARKSKLRQIFSIDIQNVTMNQPLILNAQGISYNSIELFSLRDFLSNIDKFKESLSETTESLILFIDKILSSLHQSQKIGCVSFSVQGSNPLGYRHLIYLEPYNSEDLESIVASFNAKYQSLNTFKLEVVKESLIENLSYTRKDFLNLLSSCDDKKGFLFLSRDQLEYTKKLYFDYLRLDSSEKELILNNLDYLNESIHKGYFDTEINIINDVGYMFIKFNLDKAFSSFSYGLKLKKSIMAFDWISEEHKDYFQFIYYNLAIINALKGKLKIALELLEFALVSSKKLVESANLYTLVMTDSGSLSIEEHSDVSVRKMINKNITLLNNQISEALDEI